LADNQSQLTKYENTELLKKYIQKLNELSTDKSLEVNSLFIKYQQGENFDHLFIKYGLDIEKLNSLEYLNREKTLKDEPELKENLIENINLGYKLATSEGMYYYLIDYQKFIDTLGEGLTNEYKDYLKLLALNVDEPFMIDGSLAISAEKLTERILQAESFRLIYPYSELLPTVNEIYMNYINVYFYGDLHDPNYDRSTLRIKDEAIKEFKNAQEKYPYTNFGDIITTFIKALEENNYIVNDDVRNKLKERLN